MARADPENRLYKNAVDVDGVREELRKVARDHLEEASQVCFVCFGVFGFCCFACLFSLFLPLVCFWY